MNSLEDAFVNIGMDEDKFLERNADRLKSGQGASTEHSTSGKSSSNNKNDYTNFSDIVVPECLKNPPIYDFYS
jgi:ATP-binding cassette, subfamily A (ABC1), member 3